MGAVAAVGFEPTTSWIPRKPMNVMVPVWKAGHSSVTAGIVGCVEPGAAGSGCDTGGCSGADETSVGGGASGGGDRAGVGSCSPLGGLEVTGVSELGCGLGVPICGAWGSGVGVTAMTGPTRGLSGASEASAASSDTPLEHPNAKSDITTDACVFVMARLLCCARADTVAGPAYVSRGGVHLRSSG
jgi:hypothetical protein